MSILDPKCLKNEQELFISSRGYLLPCCWHDRMRIFDDEIADLVQEKYKISNVDSIEDIIQSEDWKDFYSNLSRGIGPNICKAYCVKGFETKDLS